MTLHRLLLSGLVALGMTPATVATAPAQPFTGASAGSAVGQAYALAARIHAFHRWTGSTPPPASYCPTMRAGEAIMVELARLANRAIRYHQPGLRWSCNGRAIGWATNSTKRRRSMTRPVSLTTVTRAWSYNRRIHLAQSSLRSSNEECLSVVARRMQRERHSTRVAR